MWSPSGEKLTPSNDTTSAGRTWTSLLVPTFRTHRLCFSASRKTYTTYRPSGEIAAFAALPFSVSFAICIFCRLKTRVRVSSLYAPNVISPSVTSIAAAIRGFDRWGFERARGTNVGSAATTLELEGAAATEPLADIDRGTATLDAAGMVPGAAVAATCVPLPTEMFGSAAAITELRLE